MDNFVLDTSALFTLIEKEDGVEEVVSLLRKASFEEVEVFISVVSCIEVFYVSLQEQNEQIVRERLSLIEVMPATIVNVEDDFTESIGILKATYQMSFADCCIAGLAKNENAILVHKDPEFEQVENEIRQIKLPYKIQKKK